MVERIMVIVLCVAVLLRLSFVSLKHQAVAKFGYGLPITVAHEAAGVDHKVAPKGTKAKNKKAAKSRAKKDARREERIISISLKEEQEEQEEEEEEDLEIAEGMDGVLSDDQDEPAEEMMLPALPETSSLVAPLEVEETAPAYSRNLMMMHYQLRQKIAQGPPGLEAMPITCPEVKLYTISF